MCIETFKYMSASVSLRIHVKLHVTYYWCILYTSWLLFLLSQMTQPLEIHTVAIGWKNTLDSMSIETNIRSQRFKKCSRMRRYASRKNHDGGWYWTVRQPTPARDLYSNKAVKASHPWWNWLTNKDASKKRPNTNIITGNAPTHHPALSKFAAKFTPGHLSTPSHRARPPAHAATARPLWSVSWHAESFWAQGLSRSLRILASMEYTIEN